MNPIIIFENILPGLGFSATPPVFGYNINNLFDLKNYTYYKPNTNNWSIQNDNLPQLTVNSVAIVNNNIGASSYNIRTVRHDTYNFTMTGNNKVVVGMFDSGDDTNELYISGSTPEEISMIFAGNRIQFPVPPDVPYIPFIETNIDETNVSETGNFLGTICKYKKIEINAQFSYLQESFVEGILKPFFLNYALYKKPFIYAWDLEHKPNDIFLVRLKQDANFQAPRSQASIIDTFTLNMEGIRL